MEEKALEWVKKYYSGEIANRIRFMHMNHVLQISSSIVLTYFKVQMGGGFVQALVSNSFIETFQRADSVNRQYLDVYVDLLLKLNFTSYEEVFND
jgi:hypothetical protein